MGILRSLVLFTGHEQTMRHNKTPLRVFWGIGGGTLGLVQQACWREMRKGWGLLLRITSRMRIGVYTAMPLMCMCIDYMAMLNKDYVGHKALEGLSILPEC